MRIMRNPAGRMAAVAVMLWAGLAAKGKVEPAQVFCDHMVLQRDKPAPVWGWAEPGAKVTVQFAGQRKTATAGDDGRWQVVLDPLATSCQGRKLSIGDGQSTVEIKDVLVGDVWLCSGQSNMGRSVDRSVIPPGMKWNHPLIRYWGAGKDAPYPLDRYPAAPSAWQVCADEPSTRGCVAVGFFFARRIQQEVQVPIGLLWQAWAGSIIQEWIGQEAWHLDPALEDMARRVDACYPNTPYGRQVWKQRLADIEAWMVKARRAMDQNLPFPYPQPLMPQPGRRDICGFYNGKIHPLMPYALRGVLWYQGESDMRNNRWDTMLKVMARSWRQGFSVRGDGQDISFYWVQIQRSGDYCSPLIRQEQFNALKLIPNSGMAVLLDLDVNVHPANKVDSGIRLALWALHRDYGRKDVVPSGPLYKTHRVVADKVIVEFDYADGGLRLGSKDMLHQPVFIQADQVPNVELAGADGKWYKARARIVGDRLEVTSPQVGKPVHVRYCYANIPQPPFLYNAAGLPAAMFTTAGQ